MNEDILRMLQKRYEELKAMQKDVSEVDLKDEMNELLEIYEVEEKGLREAEEHWLTQHRGFMKRYLEVVEEREKITRKLDKLREKISLSKGEPCKENHEQEEDDEGDDE